MSESQTSNPDAAVPAYRGMQKTADTVVAGVDGNAQASDRSHAATPIAARDEMEGSAVDVEQEAIVTLPTDGSEATSAESSGTDSHWTEDLTPELFAQVQQAIAPALATPPRCRS